MLILNLMPEKNFSHKLGLGQQKTWKIKECLKSVLKWQPQKAQSYTSSDGGRFPTL